MSKLEELREFVKERFDQADVTQVSKEYIDMLGKIQKDIEDVSREQDELVSKNAELMSSYKELVKHTSFKDESAKTPTDPVGTPAPSLEDVLKQFIEK